MFGYHIVLLYTLQ